ERDVEFFVAQRVTGGDVADTDERGDVTSVNAFDIFTFAALNDHEAADAFALARARIVNRVALLELTGIDAEEHEFSSVRIGPQFERERAILVVIVRFDGDNVVCARLSASGSRNVQRAGQVIDDGVDENLDTFLFES